MTTYEFPYKKLRTLAEKTVLITGCGSGIGRETAIGAFQHGANLILGDWDEEAGMKLVKDLGTDWSRIVFGKTDVSSWTQLQHLFKMGIQQFGTIDAVMSNAGINKVDFLTHTMDAAGNLEPPDLKVVEVNLIAHIYVVKLAMYWFGLWRGDGKARQIVLVGSAASFLDTAPAYLYCAAKAGVVGLMRGLRTQTIKQNVSVNVVAPWLTLTNMLPPSLVERWGDLPKNKADDVAKALLLPVLEEGLNGKSLFVAGGQIVDLEDTLHKSQHQWMGEKLSADVDKGQVIMTLGDYRS